ncbi:MAG: transcriptional regulator, AraC family [Paenibacillus sp.]|nr:transcriptional regulator, AraC family [Paenibacillus sp.]
MLLQKFSPHPQFSDYIDSILVQEDFNPVNFANRCPVKVLPSTLTVIGIQYGNRMKVVGDDKEDLLGTSGITGLQTTVKQYLSTGSIGTIIIRFKPGGLTAFTPYPIYELRDANIDLDLVFPSNLVSEMEQKLADATNAGERIAVVHKFLLSLLNQKKEDQLIMQVTRQIQQQTEALSIEQLAREFFISKRTLERKFKTLIGISPKSFANIVRFQRAIQLRKSGLNYLDIIQACNFSDHAHFANDFKAFAGCSPESFFRSEFQPELVRHFNEHRAQIPLAQTMYQ